MLERCPGGGALSGQPAYKDEDAAGLLGVVHAQNSTLSVYPYTRLFVLSDIEKLRLDSTETTKNIAEDSEDKTFFNHCTAAKRAF